MKKIFLILIFGLSTFTLAEDISLPTKDETEPTIIEKPTSDQIFRDSSNFNRMNKTTLITAQLLGSGPSFGTSLGLTLGKYLNLDSLITFEITKGSGNRNSTNFDEYAVSTFSSGLSYKKFVANSFYYRVGIDYKTVDYKYTSKNSVTGLTQREDKFNGQSGLLTFVIGNQWQWENFTLGCDWFGYSLPLYSSISNSSSVGISTNFESLNSYKEDYIKSGTISLLRFYLGASF